LPVALDVDADALTPAAAEVAAAGVVRLREDIVVIT
jgi:hypothetical protein